MTKWLVGYGFLSLALFALAESDSTAELGAVLAVTIVGSAAVYLLPKVLTNVGIGGTKASGS